MASGMLKDQRICIVGGTAGIGFAIARHVALEGGDVTIAGRNAEKADQAAASIGLGVKSGTVDVLDEQSIKRFFSDLGPIDHLVVTAAQVQGGSFKTGDLATARRSVEGKFWSQYLCARHAQVSGSILFFSGVLSHKPMPGATIIGAVNGAIDALGRGLAVELAPVRVNVISPGLVQGTEAFSDMTEDDRRGMFEGAARNLPAGLVGDGDSVAGIACALLASPYATGSIVAVDGGGILI